MFIDEVLASFGFGRVQRIGLSDLWNEIFVKFDGMVEGSGWREFAVFWFVKNVLVVFERRGEVNFRLGKVLCDFGGQCELPDDGGGFRAISFFPPLGYLCIWVHSEVTDQVLLGEGKMRTCRPRGGVPRQSRYLDRSFCPIYKWVNIPEPGHSQDDVLFSTI